MTDHTLERCVHIRALPATVFGFFTDTERFARWWGPGSEIEPEPGGAVRIAYPGGFVASGTVERIEPDRRIVFSYGYEDGKGPIPPGSTRVEIAIEPHPLGTLLRLTHTFGDAEIRDQHVPGWRYHLGVFANIAARAQHADLDDLFDRFFAAQLVDGLGPRREAIAALVSDDFTFRDTLACVTGPGELAEHIEAARQHGPAVDIRRAGAVRHCQGVALVDWVAHGPGGGVVMRGTNVADLAPDGRIASLCGLWEMP